MRQLLNSIICSITIFSSVLYSQTVVTINSTSSLIVDADVLVLEISAVNDGIVLDSLNYNHYNNIHNILNVLNKYNYQAKDINLVESNIGNEPLVFLPSFGDNSSDEAPKYFAKQTYRILINDFSIFEDLKKDLVDNGAKLIKIMSFGTSKYEEIKKQAYSKALSDAKKKVETLYTLPYKEIRIKEIYDNTNNWEEKEIDKILTFDKIDENVVKAEKRLITTITNAKVEIKASLRVDFEIIK